MAMNGEAKNRGAIKTVDRTHFVLTRFNVRSFYHVAEPTDEWLRRRLELFERFCLPCLARQTNNNFRWLVFVDNLSPAWFLEEINKLGQGLFETVRIEGAFDSTAVSTAVGSRTDSSYILTTRVDNDDAVASDFIATIQSCFAAQNFTFLNLVTGAQYADGKVYLRPYTKNPFLTLAEKVGDSPPATVFVEHHYRVDEKGPIQNIRTLHPMWLQVIHGGNVLNEVVGLRVPGKRFARHFDCDLTFNDSYGSLVAEVFLGFMKIIGRLARKPARVGELARVLVAGRPARNGLQ